MPKHVGRQFKRIHMIMDYNFNSVVARYDLTTAQADMLILLFHNKGTPMCQKDIEERLGLKNPTVTGTLKRLEAKGLVHSGFDSADRRVKSVYLTAEGWGFISAVREHNAQMEQRITAGMDAQEVECLRLLLRRVLENILNDNGGQYAQNEKNT